MRAVFLVLLLAVGCGPELSQRCEVQEDCPAGFGCELGLCLELQDSGEPCVSERFECKEGLACSEHGFCYPVTPCQESAECGEGLVCQSHKHAATRHSVAGDTVNVYGSCHSPSAVDEPCGRDEECSPGLVCKPGVVDGDPVCVP